MSENLNDLIQQYAVESGVIAPAIPLDAAPVGDVLQEVLSDELQVSREPSLGDKLEHANNAEVIADQLDELAARADEQAGEDRDEVLAAVSVESMHREFGTLMRAHGLTLKAESFESADGDAKMRALALSKDARHVAEMSRGYAEATRDFSPEGAVVSFLRRDKSRLEAAHKALQAAGSLMSSKASELGKKGAVIKHDGMAHFLTVNNTQVKDFAKAFKHDAEWLKKGVALIGSAMGELEAACGSFKSEEGADNEAALAKVKSVGTSIASKLSGMATKDLLGNKEFHVDGQEGGAAANKIFFPKAELAVLKKAPGQAVKGVLKIGLGLAVGTLVGMPLAGVAAGAGHHLGTTVKENQKAFNDEINKSDAQSVITASGMQSVISQCGEFQGILDRSLEKHIETLGAKIDHLPKSAKREVKYGMSALSEIASELYEHAIYLTVQTAQLAKAAAAGA